MEQNYTKPNEPNHVDTSSDYKIIIKLLNEALLLTIEDNNGMLIELNENIKNPFVTDINKVFVFNYENNIFIMKGEDSELGMYSVDSLDYTKDDIYRVSEAEDRLLLLSTMQILVRCLGYLLEENTGIVIELKDETLQGESKISLISVGNQISFQICQDYSLPHGSLLTVIQ